MRFRDELICWIKELSSLLLLDSKDGRKAFLLQAGLDEILHTINLETPVSTFCPLLIDTLLQCGIFTDGQDPLEALIRATQSRIGSDHQLYSEELLRKIQEYRTQHPIQEALGALHPDNTIIVTMYGHYLRRLLNQANQVHLADINRKLCHNEGSTSLSLGAIYTALLTRATKLREQFDKREEIALNSRLRRLSVIEEVNFHQRLVLLGGPGSGKSTFVRFMAICLAGELLGEDAVNIRLLTAPLPDSEGNDQKQSQQWEHGALLPLLVTLRDFAAKGLPSGNNQANAKHLWDFIANELKESLLEADTLALQQHLQEYGGLILLDGLDEVPEADKRRTQIKQSIEDFALAFSKCRIIVTSRTYAYQQQDWQLSGFHEAILTPFSDGQIRRFVHRWYQQMATLRGMSDENAHGGAELLKQEIFQSKYLYDLAKRPLLLTLIASLHAGQSDSLPKKRVALYAQATDLLLNRWERAKVVKDSTGEFRVVQSCLSEVLAIGEDALLQALSKLAFYAHRDQSGDTDTADIPEEQLVNILWNIRKSKDLRIGRLIEYLSDRAGLIVSQGNKVYTFPHRTFQEYLAAFYLTDEMGDGENYPENIAALARLEPNRWREVVLLAAAKSVIGASSIIWLLADELCGCTTDDENATVADAWGALFAGQALVENDKVSGLKESNQRKCARIKEWLIAILTESVPGSEQFPVTERALAGKILAQLGDPRPGVGLKESRFPDFAWCKVSAGTFMMGSDPERIQLEMVELENTLTDGSINDKVRSTIFKDLLASELPKHAVYLSDYEISRYPVTNAQYQAFVEDGGYTEKWRICWSEEAWNWKENQNITAPRMIGGDFDFANHPIAGVSWHEAIAFGRWVTLCLQKAGELSEAQEIRLPTEAEWEKAARGVDERLYPWGNQELDTEYANYYKTLLGATSSVGCFHRGVSPFQCEDMAGNVWEWCYDCYDKNYYKTSPQEHPLCVMPEGHHTVRGGDWGGLAGYCRTSARARDESEYRDSVVGFRLVKALL